MASEGREEGGQMILLAGVLIVLAFFLYSTQSTVISSLGQEAGREASNPLIVDYQAIRSGIATGLSYEIYDQYEIPRCVTNEAEYRGRVQAVLTLISKLEANRGQIFVGNFVDMVEPIVDIDNDDANDHGWNEMETEILLYLTNGRAVIRETVTFLTECAP